MTKKTILVFAYSDVGHACLSYLLERGEPVAAVYTHEDGPSETIWFPSVLKLAQEKKIPVRTVSSLKSAEEQSFIASLSPDLIFSFYYRNMIPMEVLRSASLGAYNMHGSLLPKYRGRAPINWAVLHGEKETGVTLHVMVEKPDAGDIVDQESVPIGLDDTSALVQARVTKAAVTVLSRQIDLLKEGRSPRTPQDASEATYFGRRKPEDGRIDWNRPAQDIHNLVRAVAHPYPGAYADIHGIKTYIWASRLSGDLRLDKKPGEGACDGDRFFIQCGDGRALEVVSAQREGEKETTGSGLAPILNHNIKKRGTQ